MGTVRNVESIHARRRLPRLCVRPGLRVSLATPQHDPVMAHSREDGRLLFFLESFSGIYRIEVYTNNMSQPMAHTLRGTPRDLVTRLNYEPL